MYDLIIKGGRLFSPGDGLDETGDVAVDNGKIVAIGRRIDSDATEIVDARGCYVSPGFIDMHVHGYAYNTDYGTFPDQVGVEVGVTTVVDQGSCGALTFPGFKHFMVNTSVTRVLSFINIGAVGTIKGSMLPPLHCPQAIEEDLTIKTIEDNRDIIKGIKTHAEMGGYSRWGLEVLRIAKKVSRMTEVPCYVHTGKLFPADEGRLPHPDVVIPEAVQMLDKHDILTHCFTGHPGGIVRTDGRVHPEVLEALERGVLLDVGYGEHFSFEVAERVLDQGVRPHILSSDVHAPFNDPHSLKITFGLNGAMSRMLTLGFELAEVVEMVTNRPAEILKMSDRIGHLVVGCDADLTLFQVENGSYEFSDPWGNVRRGNQRVQSTVCIKSGKMFRLNVPERESGEL